MLKLSFNDKSFYFDIHRLEDLYRDLIYNISDYNRFKDMKYREIESSLDNIYVIKKRI